MTTFLKNRDMKFSFHLLLACIALTACGESGKTTADYRIVPCPGRNRARRRRRFRTGRPHPDRMHRRQRRHARQCGVSRRICRIGRRLGPRNHRSGRPLRRRQGSHPAGRRAGQRRRSVRNRGFREPHHRQRRVRRRRVLRHPDAPQGDGAPQKQPKCFSRRSASPTNRIWATGA